MAKRKRTEYRPNKAEISDYLYCLKRGVAYVPEKNTSGNYYIKRLFLNKDLVSEGSKKDGYMRVDRTKSDKRKVNRKTFSYDEVWREVFKLYNLTRDNI